MRIRPFVCRSAIWLGTCVLCVIGNRPNSVLARAADVTSGGSREPVHPAALARAAALTNARARVGALDARPPRRSSGLRILGCTGGGESISPCTQSVTLGVGGQTQRTFTVLNNSPEEDFTTTGCTVSGAAASCSVSPTSLAVPNGGASRAFTVTFHAGNTAGSGTVTATTSGSADLSATISVTVIAPVYAVQVTPKGGATVSVNPSHSDTTAFTVTNSGNGTATFQPNGDLHRFSGAERMRGEPSHHCTRSRCSATGPRHLYECW